MFRELLSERKQAEASEAWEDHQSRFPSEPSEGGPVGPGKIIRAGSCQIPSEGGPIGPGRTIRAALCQSSSEGGPKGRLGGSVPDSTQLKELGEGMGPLSIIS